MHDVINTHRSCLSIKCARSSRWWSFPHVSGATLSGPSPRNFSSALSSSESVVATALIPTNACVFAYAPLLSYRPWTLPFLHCSKDRAFGGEGEPDGLSSSAFSLRRPRRTGHSRTLCSTNSRNPHTTPLTRVLGEHNAHNATRLDLAYWGAVEETYATPQYDGMVCTPPHAPSTAQEMLVW